MHDNLYKEFNPVRFSGDEWVAIAIAAGDDGCRFVKNLKIICDANRLRCEEADGRYEIVRARPAAKESEPPDGGGANGPLWERSLT